MCGSGAFTKSDPARAAVRRSARAPEGLLVWRVVLMSMLRNAALALAALGLTAAAGSVSAQPVGGQLSTGVYDESVPLAAQPAAYFWGGRSYCWYDGGWHGPGWYWCGYAGRVGWGWGGPIGW